MNRLRAFSRNGWKSISSRRAEFAREVGMDAGILRSILNGKKKSISIRNLMQIAKLFSVSLQQLMDMLG